MNLETRDGVIWRYMDTARFLALLEDAALHFANAVSFEDPFEGSIPLRNISSRIARIVTEFDSATPFLEAFTKITQRPGVDFPDADGFISGQVKYKIELREKLIAQSKTRDDAVAAWIGEHNFDSLRHYWDRQNIFINCWHESDYESAAMWKLYSNNEHSVCIKSRISKLRECFDSSITVQRVRYIDFATDEIPALNEDSPDLFVAHGYKRNSFAHEREVRAMFAAFDHLEKQGKISYGMPLKKLGMLKPVNLNSLIEGVHVAPNSPPWYLALIGKTMARYGLTSVARMSSLVADPLY